MIPSPLHDLCSTVCKRLPWGQTLKPHKAFFFFRRRVKARCGTEALGNVRPSSKAVVSTQDADKTPLCCPSLSSAGTKRKNLLRTAFLSLEDARATERCQRSEGSDRALECFSLLPDLFHVFWSSLGCVLFFLLTGSEEGKWGRVGCGRQRSMSLSRPVTDCAKELLKPPPWGARGKTNKSPANRLVLVTKVTFSTHRHLNRIN